MGEFKDNFRIKSRAHLRDIILHQKRNEWYQSQVFY